MTRQFANARRATIAALAGCALAAMTAVAAAQMFPGNGGGPAYHSDLVTGYPCVSNNCDVIRIPDANCICVKQNPSEQVRSNVRLKCHARQGGRWVACPIDPLRN